MLKPFSSRKKVIVVGVLVVLALLLVFSYFLPKDFSLKNLGQRVGPPPEDQQERLAWLSENIDNNDHQTFVELDYEVPSWKELDEINKTVSRKYPYYIKAVQTYGTLPNLVEVLYFGDVLKDLGVNTQFIHANYWLKGDDLKLWYLGYDNPKDMSQDEAKRALVHNILLAKKQGLSVILFPDYVQFEDGGMKEHDVSVDELKTHLKKVALELAPLAEKYNADYFVPVNQIEAIMDSNGYPAEETRKAMNEFYQEIVPEIRKIYSGKIFYKMGGFSDWSNYEGVSLEGADMFGVTSCSRAPNPEFVKRDVQASSEQATKMSRQYGIPWIGAEFFVSNEGDQMMTFGEVKTDYPIEENYKAGLQAFNQYASTAKGFTVHSLLGGGKIYDTPAYPLVKEFFASK